MRIISNKSTITIEEFYKELNKEIDKVHLSERGVRKTVFRTCGKNNPNELKSIN